MGKKISKVIFFGSICSLVLGAVFFSVNFAKACSCVSSASVCTGSGGTVNPNPSIVDTCSAGDVCCDAPVAAGGGTGALLPDGATCAGSATCQSGNCIANASGQFVCSSGSGTLPISPTTPTTPTNPAASAPAAGSGAAATGGWSLGSISGFGLPNGTIYAIISNIFYWLMAMLGIIGVIGFIISGILYLISTGDETIIERAKAAMKWSIVGVIVGLMGVVIIQAIDLALRGYAGF